MAGKPFYGWGLVPREGYTIIPHRVIITLSIIEGDVLNNINNNTSLRTQQKSVLKHLHVYVINCCTAIVNNNHSKYSTCTLHPYLTLFSGGDIIPCCHATASFD